MTIDDTPFGYFFAGFLSPQATRRFSHSGAFHAHSEARRGIPWEYADQYEVRDGIGRSIDYYNHCRPHQSLDYVTPYDMLTPYGMLTGRAAEIIQQRRERHLSAQKERKRVDRRLAER